MSQSWVSLWGDWKGTRSEHSREAELDPFRPWGRRDAPWAGWSGTDDRLAWSVRGAWEAVEDPSATLPVEGWSTWAFAPEPATSDGSSWRGEALSRHSGTIEALDKVSRSLVVGETGGGVKEGKAEVTRRYSITVTSSTAWVRVRGAKGAGLSGGPAESMELSIAPWQAKVGDGVTVHVRPEGRSLVALKITVVPPER